MRRPIILLLIMVLGTAAALAQAPASWDNVTVTTTDGWNLPGCTVRWFDDGSKVRVTRADGTYKDYDPWLVRQVVAADGTDLTSTIAAARPGDPASRAGAHAEEPAPAGGYSEVGVAVSNAAPANNLVQAAPKVQLFKASIGAGAGYGAYSGDWFMGFEDDLNYHGKVRFNYGGKEWITLGYQRQKGGSEEGTYYVDGIGDVSVSAEIHINEFQLLAGTAIGKAAPGAPFGYFEGGLVILHHVVSGSVSGYGSESYSETKLGAQLQLGGMIPVGKSMAVDLGVSAVVKSSLFSDEEAGGLIFGLHAGLAYVQW